jgi:GT2 family glycosyltransferase
VLHERYTRVCYPAWKERAIEQLFDRSESLAVLCPQLADRVSSDRVYAGDIFQTMIVGTLVNMPSVAVRAGLIDVIGGFDETMATGEDYDFNLRACSAGRAAFIDRPTVLYRVGASDQLTRPSLHVDQARNYFRAVAPFLAGTGRPIRLTRAKLNAVLAGKYHWLGASELDNGVRRAARSALWRSIRYGNRRPRVFAQLGMSVMPAGFERRLRALYRRLKSA